MRLYKSIVAALFVAMGIMLSFFPQTEDVFHSRHVLASLPALHVAYGLAFGVAGVVVACSIRWERCTRIAYGVALGLGLAWLLLSTGVLFQYDADSEPIVLWAFFCAVQMRAILVWESRAYQTYRRVELDRRLETHRGGAPI